MIAKRYFRFQHWTYILFINLILGIVWLFIFLFLFRNNDSEENRVIPLLTLGIVISILICQTINLLYFLKLQISIETIFVIQLIFFGLIWFRDYPTNIFFLTFSALNYFSTLIVNKYKINKSPSGSETPH